MQVLIQGAASRSPRAQLRRVSMLRPFVWIGRGTADLVRCWRQDLAHALLMVAFGWVLLFLLDFVPRDFSIETAVSSCRRCFWWLFRLNLRGPLIRGQAETRLVPCGPTYKESMPVSD